MDRFQKRTKSITTARKSIFKLIKLQSLVAKCCKMKKILKQPCEVCKFCILLYSARKTFTTFGQVRCAPSLGWWLMRVEFFIVDLSCAFRVFLRVLQFSSLSKINAFRTTGLPLIPVSLHWRNYLIYKPIYSFLELFWKTFIILTYLLLLTFFPFMLSQPSCLYYCLCQK